MGSFSVAAVGAAAVLVLSSILSHADQDTGTNGCDFFQGSWIFDHHAHALYNKTQCPFLEKEFTCQHNGRPDDDYLKYRWQPNSCNLPRFDAENFFSKYKGKAIMFVGDSLILNQWQSLTCMLHVAVPEAPYTLTRINKGISDFNFPTYNVSVLLSRNALLVDITTEENLRVLNLDTISSASGSWEGIDTLVFDTWQWWLHTGRKQPWDVIKYGDTLYKDMNRLLAYEKALNTWARWVESRVDPSKTKVIFQGVTPDTSCKGEREPLKNPVEAHPAEIVLERVLQGLSKPVHLLNITALSQIRVDAHPSIYGLARRAVDCIHFCLPGVPDTWNQLLFSILNQNIET